MAALHGQNRAEDEVAPSAKNFGAIVKVLEEVMSHSPNVVVSKDAESNLIAADWLRDVIYDVIELISSAPTYEHETIGVKVLCWLCKVYQLHSAQTLDYRAIWTKLDLTNDNELIAANQEELFSADLLWLIEMWYLQIKLIMKQPKKSWFFSREALDRFAQRNPFMAWKLAHDALSEFSLCKNSWSMKEIFVFIGNLSDKVEFAGDDGQKVIKHVLQDVAKRMIKPLKKCVDWKLAMDRTRRQLIVQSAGRFVRRLTRYKLIEGKAGKYRRELMGLLYKTKLEWGQRKLSKAAAKAAKRKEKEGAGKGKFGGHKKFGSKKRRGRGRGGPPAKKRKTK